MGQPRSAAGSCLLLSWQKRPYIFACPHHNGAVGRKHDVVRSIEPRATSSIMHCSMAMRHSADDGSCDRPMGRTKRTAAVQRCSGVPRCSSDHAGFARDGRRAESARCAAWVCAIRATAPASRPHRPRAALHRQLMLWINRPSSERPAPAFARAGLRVAKPLDSARERAPRCDRVLGADYSGSASPRAAARA